MNISTINVYESFKLPTTDLGEKRQGKLDIIEKIYLIELKKKGKRHYCYPDTESRSMKAS